MLSRGRAEVDLSAIAANVAAISDVVGESQLCAVVKADGYGHGSLQVARTAVEAGAQMVAVATVAEAESLRSGGLRCPMMLLSEAHDSEADLVVECGLVPMLYSRSGLMAYSVAARNAPKQDRFGVDPKAVHLKVDTGMNRVGASPSDVLDLAEFARGQGLTVGGLCTHLACADDPNSLQTARQLERFETILAELREHDFDPEVVHVANSAGALVHPKSRYDLVRCGISIYGLAPSPEVAEAISGLVELRPALSLISRVSFVKTVGAGEGISYGHTFRTERPESVATIPLGYGDGIPRALGNAGGSVLIGGHRHPIVGNVTMDQFMVLDTSPNRSIRVDDEVVLIGSQGDHEVTATDWAEALGTINYEIVTRLSARLQRTYI